MLQNEDGRERRECRAMQGRGIILKAFLLIPLSNIPLPNFPDLGCGLPRWVFALKTCLAPTAQGEQTA
jgi:hypothetical protein